MYVLSWRTVSALTRVLFWYLFPSLLRNSENKHQNNPLVSAETVRHLSIYIILYIMWQCALKMESHKTAVTRVTSSVTSCDKVSITTTLGFQWLHPFLISYLVPHDAMQAILIKALPPLPLVTRCEIHPDDEITALQPSTFTCIPHLTKRMEMFSKWLKMGIFL